MSAAKKAAKHATKKATGATKATGTGASDGGAKLIERAVAAKEARLAREGRADIGLIKRRKSRIAEDFYDIGEALARLKRPGVAEALGHASFGELCDAELEMSLSKAAYLIAIVTRVARKDAAKFGQDRTAALLELADATPDPDTAAQLAGSTLVLPSGKTLTIARASTAQIRAAAKEFRAAAREDGATSAGKDGSKKASDTKASDAKASDTKASDATRTKKNRRGRTTSAEERSIAAALQEKLRALGLGEARVSAVAGAPGHGAMARIEGVPLAELAQLRRALGQRT